MKNGYHPINKDTKNQEYLVTISSFLLVDLNLQTAFPPAY